MNKQQGYIKIVLVVFALLIGIMIFPLKFPSGNPQGECTVGEAGDGSVLSGLPAIKNLYDEPRLGQPSDLDIGGPDETRITDYVLIRTKVPTSKNSTPEGWKFLGGTTKSSVEHTVNVGELPQKPGFDAYYPSEWGEMDVPEKGRLYIRGQGLLIFTNNDPSTIKTIGDNTVYMADIYQIKEVFDDSDKGYEEGDLFICGVDTEVGSTYVTQPPQEFSGTKDQLQLEWFLFSGDKVWGVHCKPAVYLYPIGRQLVNVKVFPKGELSYADPVYDKEKGWTVWAEPGGNLESGIWNMESKKYNYLYYESKLFDAEIKKPEMGWVVKMDGVEGLFNEILPELGLNNREQADFMSYWLGKLPESSYYFVGLVDKDQRDFLEVLEVNPKPDTSIRFSLYFEPLDSDKEVTKPVINTQAREGFTLVDWGGMIKLHPGTPFTCSQ